jgi:hypothetical protein
VIELRIGHRLSAPDAVPLLETSAAAGGGRVLRDEHRMSAKGRLPSVFLRVRRRESLQQEIACVRQHGVESLLLQIGELGTAKMKFRAKGRSCERWKNVVEVTHASMVDRVACRNDSL